MLGFISMTIVLVVMESFTGTLSWLSRALAGVQPPAGVLRAGLGPLLGDPFAAADALCVSLVACCLLFLVSIPSFVLRCCCGCCLCLCSSRVSSSGLALCHLANLITDFDFFRKSTYF